MSADDVQAIREAGDATCPIDEGPCDTLHCPHGLNAPCPINDQPCEPVGCMFGVNSGERCSLLRRRMKGLRDEPVIMHGPQYGRPDNRREAGAEERGLGMCSGVGRERRSEDERAYAWLVWGLWALMIVGMAVTVWAAWRGI